jgi:hypothetical protein
MLGARPNNGGSLELAAIVEFDALVSGSDGTSFREDDDAGLFHFLTSEFAESRSDFRQDLILTMYHSHDNIFFSEAAVEAGAAANKFIEFAHNNEVDERTAALGIASGFGLFHSTDDVLAKVDGVAHDLERESMLGHARDDAEVAVRSTRDNQVVGC